MASTHSNTNAKILIFNELKLAYNILNLFSGFLELGCVIFLIVKNENIIFIILAGLAYQLGNLASSMIKVSKKTILIIVFLSVLFLIVYLLTEILPFYLVTIASISTAIQYARRLIVSNIGSDSISTFSKRLLRIVGFLAASWASSLSMLIASVGTVIVICFLSSVKIQPRVDVSANNKTKRNTLSRIMIIHQSHYFSYAYWLPILFLNKLHVPFYSVGLFFIIGWVSYIYSEKLFGGFNVIWVFIFGHLTVAISLVLMGLFSDSLPVVLIAWFISGLGGGTVFCLKRLNKVSMEPIDLDLWEDIGHVSGVLISLIFAIIFMNQTYFPFWISALIALITAISMWIRKGEVEQKL